jgi:hypothetical protein
MNPGQVSSQTFLGDRLIECRILLCLKANLEFVARWRFDPKLRAR